MASMSISGVVSGMDWESMIDEIITAAAKPAQVQVAKKTNLQNKKSLFEEMKVMVQSIQSSMTSLKLPSTYKAKAVDIERVDSSGSYKGVLTATVNADAEVNVYDIVVQQLASAQTNRSKQITASSIASTLASGGVTGTSSKMYITTAGQRVGIDVYSTDSLQSLKSRINTTIKTLANPLDVTASVVDNKLVLKSDNTGLGQSTAEETITYTGGNSTLKNIAVEEGGTVSITGDGNSYTQGTDFVVVNGTDIRWNQYDRGNEVALGTSVNAKYTMTAGDVYSSSGQMADSDGEGEVVASVTGFTIIDKGTLGSRVKIVDSSGTEYVYGRDFTLDSNGKVVWEDATEATTNEPASYTVNYVKTTTNTTSFSGTDDNIASSDFASLKAAYNEHLDLDEDTDLPMITLLDSDGVLRTYLDPEDRSLFTLSAVDTSGNTVNYTYGRDYVIRVNDAGNGYAISWLVSDGSTDIKDANNVVTAYMAEKGISSLGWKAAPSSDYTFAFSYDTTIDESAKVKSSTSDKSLETLFDGITIDKSDYSSITIDDGNETTYTYGVDFKIDTDGNLVWLDKGSYAATYTFSDTDSQDTTATMTDEGYVEVSLASLNDLGLDYSSEDDYFYIDESHGKAAFTLTDSDGNSYEYGTDFLVRGYDNTSDTLEVVSVDGGALASGTTFTLTYNNTYTAYSADSDSTNIADVLGFTPDYDNLTITGGLGATYTYSSSDAEDLGDNEFTIDDDGAVTFKPEDSSLQVYNPAEGATYTLTYEAFKALTYTGHYDNEESHEAVLTVDSGDGDINDTQLSWEQILSDTGLKSSSADENFAQYFTLTDANGDTYTYGTDYRIIQGDEVALDEDTTVHRVLIDWVNGGYTPSTSSGGLDFTLTYTGRGSDGGEIIQMNDAVTRSATDTINANTTSMTLPLYSAFEGAAVRITGGGEDFQQGIDFTVEEGSSGYASIVWNTDTQGTPSYSQYFEDATSITVLDSDGNEIDPDTYTITENSLGEASFNMEDDNTLDEGDYTIKVVKNGLTKVYDLSSDGTLQTITRRSLWMSQDNTNAQAYTIYVSKNGQTTTYDGSRPAGSYDFYLNTASLLPSASDFDGGTTTITQGSKTFYKGVDFTIEDDDSGRATVNWITDEDGGYEWYYPNPGSLYTINHTDSDGTTKTYSASRTSSNELNMADYGMTTAKGALSVQYGTDELYYNLDVVDSEGNTGNDVLKATHGFTIDRREKSTGSGTAEVFTFNWEPPTLTTKDNMPSYGAALTVEYTYDANTFTLSDDGDGLIDALGLNSDVTEAHNAILTLDGEEVQRDTNYIGADYNNELLKGVTIQLKGLGEVSMDIYHDAEKAVEAITTFKDGYNDLMTWMNTRMSESQLDEDTAATVDSDDFRMRWGLLHGNSLLRNTKSQMRNIMSENFTYYFSTRTSASEIYGTMANNGLTNSATLRMRIGSTYCDLSIQPTNTLQDIVDMINDSTNPAMRNSFYDENGNLREQPLIKASISEDKLVISSTGDETINLSGTAAMNALKMNYTYRGLFQVGLSTTSTDYGKSGELEFDESKFMEALEDNPDEVQEMMLMFASNMDDWLKSMLTSSPTGGTSGTLTRQIEDIDTQIKSIDEYLEKYQERLDRQEESLRTKFAAAEQSISRLSQQASSIAAILNQLNGNNSSSSSSSTGS